MYPTLVSHFIPLFLVVGGSTQHLQEEADGDGGAKGPCALPDSEHAGGNHAHSKGDGEEDAGA